MPKRMLERYRQAAKEIRRHLDSQKYRTRSPERAFVEWYILARFGQPSDVKILDGKKDGGIDALVQSDGKLFVIQSKYEVRPKVALVTRSEIAGFEKIATNLSDKNAETQFVDWLQTVREQLRGTYKNIRQRAIQKRGDVRFIFVTTKRFQLEESGLAEVEEIQKISSLWYLYSEGFTPPTEFIELGLESAWHTSSENDDFKTYVGLAKVRDFLRLMDDDKNERLFAQNVRTDLRSPINREIRKTYEKDADRFWLGNNGIYIVCKKVIPSGPPLFVFPSLFGLRNSPKSNHSPTSAAFARKSNHSRTYAKTAGWGVCFRYPFSNVPKICRRADIFISARPATPSGARTARLRRRPLQRQEEPKNRSEDRPLQQ